ncbi:MFS general substrate transporter [Sodiomyces alkalinus F11]|uniref:MFS general substrate transporter n=1 Tax=Sodiomyces alkalinus (strain CBS 110278 / VKM F-3762 / F11) TaxID=1314773 RepID=A0A3N2PYV1_SODAK|nr:MFS general substrate transporter [Sodiomyces alkalinus F11]ROT39606.1 MFS general substrate transporter [Sodiomyces alkalinus F11]
MSLARNVGPLEGFDYEAPPGVTPQPPIGTAIVPDEEEQSRLPLLTPVASTSTNIARSRSRRLSFDAFAQPAALLDPPVERTERRASAYKVSNAKRFVVTAIVTCWFASGITFGFAALKPILIAEGIYRDLCPADDVNADRDPRIPCNQQDMRLNLFFAVASITANVGSLAAGTVLDRLGRRAAWVLGCLFFAAGCLFMAYSFVIPHFDGYLVGNFFLGLGGTFLFVPSYRLANAFPRYAGLIIALVTGAFDASAAVFLFYRIAYDATGGRPSLETFFFSYLVVPLLILLAEFTYMPRHPYHSAGELKAKIEHSADHARDVHASDDDISEEGERLDVQQKRAERRRARRDALEDLTGGQEARDERDREEEHRLEASGVWGMLHGLPAHSQMMTPWFILVLLLTAHQMLRMNFIIATLRAQYRHMLGSDELAERVNHLFDAALPIGGVLATPFVGILLHSFTVPTIFIVLTAFIVAVSFLNCLPYVWAGYAMVIGFSMYRPLYYSAISDYATKVFGFATFGRIYGALVCFSGFFSFGQYGLDAWTHGPLEGDPFPVNILLATTGTLLGITLVVFMMVNIRLHADAVKEIKDQAGLERMPLIGEEEEHQTHDYGSTDTRR